MRMRWWRRKQVIGYGLAHTHGIYLRLNWDQLFATWEEAEAEQHTTMETIVVEIQEGVVMAMRVTLIVELEDQHSKVQLDATYQPFGDNPRFHTSNFDEAIAVVVGRLRPKVAGVAGVPQMEEK